MLLQLHKILQSCFGSLMKVPLRLSMCLKRTALSNLYTSVVVIDLRYDILNYNYLWLNPQLLPLQLPRFLDNNDCDY